jgi:hypothetical protein
VIGEGELNFWGQPQHPLESHAHWGTTTRRGTHPGTPRCRSRPVCTENRI